MRYTNQCGVTPLTSADPTRHARSFGGSLSGRLLWLTVLLVLVVEVLIFVPGLAQERYGWLHDRVRDAQLAALAVFEAPESKVPAAMRAELLRLAGADLIRLDEGGRTVTLGSAPATARVIDLRHESEPVALWRALAALFQQGDERVLLVAASDIWPGAILQIVVHERGLLETLRRAAWWDARRALFVAFAAGALVYLSLLRLLVVPMRRLISGMAAFRADPQGAEPIDIRRIGALPGDDLAIAAHELAAMQDELRTALWRNAHLAALGASLAKVSHDLRGMLAPAMLSADRLTMSKDPAVERAGTIIVDAIAQVSDLMRQTIDYAREGPPALVRSVFPLRALVDDAAASIAAAGLAFSVQSEIAGEFQVTADRIQLLRVFLNLLRNAAEAGARRGHVSATRAGKMVRITISDDGPGLPEPVLAHLFRPFGASLRHGGTGLGLAIARDLMRAHGGDVVLEETGPTGTRFLLTLPESRIATHA